MFFVLFDGVVTVTQSSRRVGTFLKIRYRHSGSVDGHAVNRGDVLIFDNFIELALDRIRSSVDGLFKNGTTTRK